ncbi:MAG TPA: MgtC/SapB family protein [Phycisphaerae bacterium]|nr:MgtC/SapB family protein [Phycisphaerae bacterium]
MAGGEYILAAVWSSQFEAIGQLALAAALGGAVGLEREHRGRAAGMRTHALVAMGCCLVMVVSTYFARLYPYPQYGQESVLRIDPARIAYGVMGGIGFLGAGAIIRAGFSVRGLTTAASIWCIAAVGLAVGVKLYTISVGATLLVMFTLYVLHYVEGQVQKRWYKKLRIVCDDRPEQIKRFADLLSERDIGVLDVSFKRDMEAQRLTITYQLRLPKREMLPLLYEYLDGEEGVYAVNLT